MEGRMDGRVPGCSQRHSVCGVLWMGVTGILQGVFRVETMGVSLGSVGAMVVRGCCGDPWGSPNGVCGESQWEGLRGLGGGCGPQWSPSLVQVPQGPCGWGPCGPAVLACTGRPPKSLLMATSLSTAPLVAPCR